MPVKREALDLTYVSFTREEVAQAYLRKLHGSGLSCEKIETACPKCMEEAEFYADAIIAASPRIDPLKPPSTAQIKVDALQEAYDRITENEPSGFLYPDEREYYRGRSNAADDILDFIEDLNEEETEE